MSTQEPVKVVQSSLEQQQAEHIAQQQQQQQQLQVQHVQIDLNQQNVNYVQYAHTQQPQQPQYNQYNTNPRQQQQIVQGIPSGNDSLNTTVGGQLSVPLNQVNQSVTVITIQVEGQVIQEDESVKQLLLGPNKTRNFTDVWAAVMFACVCTIFIILGIVAFARSKPFSSVEGASSNAYGVGFGAVFTTFTVSFLIGLALQILLMRFTFYILLGSMIFVFVMIIVLGIYCIASLKNVGLLVVCIIVDLVYAIIAYGIYKKLPILDKLSKLAFQFTVEVKGQYILLGGFTFLILVEIIYYIIGLIHYVYAANEDGKKNYDQNIQLALVYIFFAIWVIGTTQQMYKFCIAYMSCQWFFGKNEENNIINTLRMAVRHIGSLAFSTLLCVVLSFVTIFLKQAERALNSCCLICLSQLIKTCRKTLMKLISSLTLVSIAHKGNNFCQGMNDISQQLADEPFYFLFVIWGADYVSSIVGFFSFLGGFALGLFIMFSESELRQGNVAVIFFILAWTVAVEVADLFTTNYRMVLYSMGSYYNLCSKYRGGHQVERFKITYQQLQLAKEGSNLEVKDIS